MYDIFARVLNMSMTAGILALAVILLRLFMKKIPRRYVCILWALVALRLLCPVSVSSPLSAFNLLPLKQGSPGRMNFFAFASSGNIVHGDTVATAYETGKAFSPFAYVWIGGTAIMLLYALVSYILLKRKVRASKEYEKNTFICDEIKTPFILGIIIPKIYLPTGMSEEVKSHVIAHEQAHIKRLDFLWKPLGFILLSIHWFNPVLWAAYIILCKDIEGACDERVIAEMDKESILSYSEALLTCAAQRRMIAACPVAFGETDVKGRIRNVLNYKKPAFWIIVLAVVACVAVGVCFLTNPKDAETVVLSETAEPGDDASKQEKFNEYLSRRVVTDLKATYDLESVDVIVFSLEKDELGGIVAVSTKEGTDKKTLDAINEYLKKNFKEYRFEVDGEEICGLPDEITLDHFPFRPYNKLEDGTWECQGREYKYYLEISGRMPNAAKDSTFVFLSNIEEIPFDRAWKAAGFSSSMADYFDVEDAILVGLW